MNILLTAMPPTVKVILFILAATAGFIYLRTIVQCLHAVARATFLILFIASSCVVCIYFLEPNYFKHISQNPSDITEPIKESLPVASTDIYRKQERQPTPTGRDSNKADDSTYQPKEKEEVKRERRTFKKEDFPRVRDLNLRD